MNIDFTDRRVLILAGGACLALFAGLWIAPNYWRASYLRTQCASLDEQTNDYISERASLDQLQEEVIALREEVATRCRLLADSPSDSRLVDALSRPVDGMNMQDQVVRMGELEFRPRGAAGEPAVEKRRVRVEMTGSFDSIFGVLHAVDQERQLNRVSSVDIHPVESGINAVVEIDEYFAVPEEAAQ